MRTDGFKNKKPLKITTTITIGYLDMPIELCENKDFRIYLDGKPSTNIPETDKQEIYERIITQIDGAFNKYKNKILANSEILKEYVFGEDKQ